MDPSNPAELIDFEETHRLLSDTELDGPLTANLGVITHALEQAIRKARRTTGTRGDLLCGLSVDRHTEDARRTADDIGQILDAVIIQAIRDAKTIAQGACEHARASGGAHECETRDIQAIERAAGPLPMTISREKSSIAGYKISST